MLARHRTGGFLATFLVSVTAVFESSGMRRSITAVVMLGICLVSGPVSAQTVLTVEPATLDFGNVKVNDLASKEITIKNVYNYDIRIRLEYIEDPNNVFSYDTPPFTLGSGNSVNLVVSFQPSSTSKFEGTLNLFYYDSNFMNPPLSGILSIPLVGYGGSTFDLVAAIEVLVSDTYGALENGDLVSTGKGKSAANRAWVFLKWIVKAETLILAGEFDEAHDLLSAVLRKVDGASSPPDFVDGTAAEPIASQILQILTALAG